MGLTSSKQASLPGRASPRRCGEFAYPALLRLMDELAEGVSLLVRGKGLGRRAAHGLHSHLVCLHAEIGAFLVSEQFRQEQMRAHVVESLGRAECDWIFASGVGFFGEKLTACADLLGRHMHALFTWAAADVVSHAGKDLLRARRLARAGRPESSLELIRRILRYAPDYSAARALLSELQGQGCITRFKAQELDRESRLGTFRSPILLPLNPRVLASDGTSILYVAAFDDDLNSSLFLCDLTTGEVRELRGMDTVYSGLWYDPEETLLYALIYRAGGAPRFGVDIYSRDGVHLKRRFFDSTRLRLQLPYFLQGGNGRLYLFEHPCRLILAFDAASMQVENVLQPAGFNGISQLKVYGDLLFGSLAGNNALVCRDVQGSRPVPFKDAVLSYPLGLDVDMAQRALFAISSDRLPRGGESLFYWLHKFAADGRCLFSHPLGTMRISDVHMMQTSGVLVLGTTCEGLLFFDVRKSC